MMALADRFLCHPITITALDAGDSSAIRIIFHVFEGLQIGVSIILDYASNPSHQAVFTREGTLKTAPYRNALIAVLRVITEAQSYINGFGSEIPYSSLCVSAGYSGTYAQLEAGGKRKPERVDSDSELDEEAETPQPRGGRKKKRNNPPTECKNKHNQLASMRCGTKGYLEWKGPGTFPIPQGKGKNICMANALVGQVCRTGTKDCPRVHLWFSQLPFEMATAVSQCVEANRDLNFVNLPGTNAKIPKKEKKRSPAKTDDSDSDEE